MAQISNTAPTNGTESRIESLARLERALDRPFFGMVPDDFAEAGIKPPTADEVLQAEDFNRQRHAENIARDQAVAIAILKRSRPELLEGLSV